MVSSCFILNLKSLLFLASLNHMEILLNIFLHATKNQILQDEREGVEKIPVEEDHFSLTSLVVEIRAR